ncbi:PQQ-dependent sugar dehydrogenase [Shewanella surugensis]|uniref:PQQ-dependent sugar dehydrogenase n=2 Tax=Shewanella surugensis TaxID=212020 RepID=A0ABT0LFE2_9GAMM|nr:PQQ-dependent sugar dehydrogenase [Shewanella surugensis]MCL1126431.1 PQQ-dependent sugar dehydrogenase [Shewanella surugensis]
MIKVANGFGISLYASNLGDAKQLAMGDKGTLFVGTGKSGIIHALVDSNGSGRVNKRYVVAHGLNIPEAIAFYQGALYVASGKKILRYRDIENNLKRRIRPEEVYNKLPAEVIKSRRAMRFGPDGRLYIAVGAHCNVCEVKAPFGQLLAINLETGNSEVIARGIRRVTGFDWSVDDKLWFADLGRDWLGDNLPADELNRVDSIGAHYGFPYMHGKTVKEAAFTKPEGLVVTEPVYELPAHVGPMGLHFYRGNQFPSQYQNQLFVAENGSWNRSSKVGYQVMLLQLEAERVVKRTTMVSFLDSEFPVAQPYSLITAPDGALFISDDFKGRVYRLFYRDNNQVQDIL